MAKPAAAALRPRKTPVQARSTATVAAVHEACVQVLLREGFRRLTTTRVAERAGVSVGTLYQYYPNKRALLAAVLGEHLGEVVAAVEAACQAAAGRPLQALVAGVAGAFVAAKLRRAEVSQALHALAAEVEGQVQVKAAMLRAHHALTLALQAAPDAHQANPARSAFFVLATAVGVVQAALDAGLPEPLLQGLEANLAALCLGYLESSQARGVV